MSKKSFRARQTQNPDYPKLGDLGPGPLVKWGLVVLGGLLLGDSACTKSDKPPLAGEAPAAKNERRQPGDAAAPLTRTPPTDAGGDERVAPKEKPNEQHDLGAIKLGIGGGLPPARIRKSRPAHDSQAQPANDLPKEGSLGGLREPRPSGTSTSPRVKGKTSQHR